MAFVDLSHEIYPHMPRIALLPDTEVSCVLRIADGRPLNAAKLSIATHTGSHVDAPYHVFEHGLTIDQIPLDTFVGRGALISVQRRGGEAIPAADLENGGVPVERGDILLIRTGWDAHFTSPEYAIHPYLSQEACDWIVERGVKLVALDSQNPDMPISLRPPDFAYPAHRTLLGHGVPIVENLCNFGPLEGVRFRVIALPLRLRGGDAGHVRVVAEAL